MIFSSQKVDSEQKGVPCWEGMTIPREMEKRINKQLKGGYEK
jgi:hypothetical protein